MLKDMNTVKIRWPEEALGHTHICWRRPANEANVDESSVCTSTVHLVHLKDERLEDRQG